jgi:hypothetical protein
MKQQPDKIFHDKLKDHTQPVPPIAWDRIERGLENKRNNLVWYSVAASLTAIAISAYIYYNSKPTEAPIAKTEVSPRVNPRPTVSVPPAIDESIQENRKQESSIANKPTYSERTEVIKIVEKKVEIVLPEVMAMQTTEKSLEQNEIPTLKDSSSLQYKNPTQLAFKAPVREHNVIIVMTADQAKEYLINNKTEEQATSGEKKTSTLKKLLQKAADLKVNQDPFGELRQRKNEILALNFKSEKQRGQKK